MVGERVCGAAGGGGRIEGMAGRPRLRAMLTAVSDIGGVEAILDRVANGETMVEIAASMPASEGYGPHSPTMLSNWLREDPERAEALLRARARAASSLAEQSLVIADSATPEMVQKARLQVDVRRWLASKYDPQQFGEKQVDVQINIAELHIDALRKYHANMVNSLPDNEIAGKLT